MVGKPRKPAGEKQTKAELKEIHRKFYENNKEARLLYAKEYYQKNKKPAYKKTGRKKKVYKYKKLPKGYFWQETSDNIILPRGV